MGLYRRLRMSTNDLVTTIEGYEPFDLLRLSKDAFYDVVAQEFPKLSILDINLSFIVIEGECLIRAEITDYKEEV